MIRKYFINAALLIFIGIVLLQSTAAYSILTNNLLDFASIEQLVSKYEIQNNGNIDVQFLAAIKTENKDFGSKNLTFNYLLNANERFAQTPSIRVCEPDSYGFGPGNLIKISYSIDTPKVDANTSCNHEQCTMTINTLHKATYYVLLINYTLEKTITHQLGGVDTLWLRFYNPDGYFVTTYISLPSDAIPEELPEKAKSRIINGKPAFEFSGSEDILIRYSYRFANELLWIFVSIVLSAFIGAFSGVKFIKNK